MTEDTEKKCFVICPIGEQASPEREWSDDIYNNLIIPIASEFNYVARRSIDDSRPGEITTNLVADIIEADLVVADLTFHNANVFYELAIRHAQAKPYIHIAKLGTKIPFDVHAHNTVMIDAATYASVDRSRSELRSQFRAVFEGNASFENPLKRYQQKLQADQTGDPLEQRILAIEEKLSRADQPDIIHPHSVRTSPNRYVAYNQGIIDSQNKLITNFLTNNSFKLIFDPARNKSKIITFDSGGSIVEGRNDNENRWRARDGRLEILQSDGNVHSRFVYVPTDRSFQHTNDSDTRSLVNQRIELDKGG
jgi:hypothetical protein